MNQEVQKMKRELDRLTPEDKEWSKLLAEKSLHLKEDAIRRWVKFPNTFSPAMQDRMHKHFNVCSECEKKRASVMPLLDQLEEAS